MKLTINYDGHDLKMEEELSEVLEKHGFECTGSGFGFGHSFQFSLVFSFTLP